jgi:hypothetical protein
MEEEVMKEEEGKVEDDGKEEAEAEEEEVHKEEVILLLNGDVITVEVINISNATAMLTRMKEESYGVNTVQQLVTMMVCVLNYTQTELELKADLDNIVSLKQLIIKIQLQLLLHKNIRIQQSADLDNIVKYLDFLERQMNQYLDFRMSTKKSTTIVSTLTLCPCCDGGNNNNVLQ